MQWMQFLTCFSINWVKSQIGYAPFAAESFKVFPLSENRTQAKRKENYSIINPKTRYIGLLP